MALWVTAGGALVLPNTWGPVPAGRGAVHEPTRQGSQLTHNSSCAVFQPAEGKQSAARPQAQAHTWLMAGLPAAAASRRCGARGPPPSKSNTALPSRRSTVTARQMGVPSSIWSRVLTVPTCRHQCAAEHSASGPSVRQLCAGLAAGASSKRQRLPEQLQLLTNHTAAHLWQALVE